MTRSQSIFVSIANTGRGLIAFGLVGYAGLVFAQQDSGAKYAQVLKSVDVTSRYNGILEQRLQSQQSQITSLQQQLASIDTTAQEVQPLLHRMFEELDRFVAADVPFYAEERSERIARLRSLIENPETPAAETYRRLLEAYQIEMEYGRTMDTFRGALTDGRDADFVRLGRVSLMYRTLDGTETGYWDNQQKAWVADASYARAIEQALRIANQEEAPDLITVPVPAPQGGRS